MSDHPDLPKANHALQVLRQARLSRNEAAAVMIGDLIYDIAYTGQRSPEIEDAHEAAWLAISELARALAKEQFALEGCAQSHNELARSADVGSRRSWSSLCSRRGDFRSPLGCGFFVHFAADCFSRLGLED